MMHAAADAIRALMAANPQQAGIEAVLSGRFGSVLRHDGSRALLRIGPFYFLDGPVDPAFARDLVSALEEPAYITAGNTGWYECLQGIKPFKLVDRILYEWPSGAEKPALKPLPPGFAAALISPAEAAQITALSWADDVFASYATVADYQAHGFGYAIKDGVRIVSLCTSFTTSSYGADIEVDTDPAYQGRGLARHAAGLFIAESLRRGLTPLWDSSNDASSRLAESLGFVKGRAYQSLLLST